MNKTLMQKLVSLVLESESGSISTFKLKNKALLVRTLEEICMEEEQFLCVDSDGVVVFTDDMDQAITNMELGAVVLTFGKSFNSTDSEPNFWLSLAL